MISVTSDMILGSVLFSLALGALAGVLHSLVHLVSGLLRTVLRRAVGDKLHLPLDGSLAGEIFDFTLTLSVGISYILIVPINLILHYFIGDVPLYAVLDPKMALFLIVLSVVLTLIGGLIPARAASKKDPVEALRSE